MLVIPAKCHLQIIANVIFQQHVVFVSDVLATLHFTDTNHWSTP